ncbi:MAG: SUMF1/EgtB/PvdO family nonheme iron enzyme [Opitutales bacterium]
MNKRIVTGIAMLLFAGVAMAQNYNIDNVSKAIADMSKDPSYPKEYAQKLEAFKAKGKLSQADQAEFDAFAREALLKNPLLQENKNWIYIKRSTKTPSKGLPANWQNNSSLNNRNKNFANQVDDEIIAFDITNPIEATPLFKPTNSAGVTDIDIDWDASKLMYSSISKKNNTWQVYELDLNTKETRILTPEKYTGVDNFDSVYLPDGNVIYTSTACYAGVPCVSGADYISNIYKLDPTKKTADDLEDSIRQLSFDQETSWSPTVMHDGRVMYTRWEYTDNSHYFSRILMRMNPDGSGQMSHYGSTSYWPNSLFYCRQIPGDPNKFVSIISGHHGTRRSGEMHLFDISKGVIEDEGRVHQYMGMGKKYEARILDKLVRDVKVQLIHPYPLSENYIVVSMMDLSKEEKVFSLYLVDKFDNATLLQTADGYDLFEAMPLAAREKPPILAQKVDEDQEFGYVFLNNIYEGPGLKGVEKGSVKKLRIFEYNYTYRDAGNTHETMGLESGWEVKKIHGTVDVEEDGSAMFKIPANRPYSLQPLDKDGRAMALFRSWVTIRPGETQSCVGCHEPSNTAPVGGTALASRKAPQTIKQFLGTPRGLSFDREIQPILDAYCVECHNPDKKMLPNFKKVDQPWKGINFSNSYLALHPYVRRSGPESNQNILHPMEFHASTSELIQILEKGHKGVNMDKDSLAVLYSWIDLNVPYHGTLREAYTAVRYRTNRKTKELVRSDVVGIPGGQEEKRAYFLKKYANRVDTFETEDPKYVQAEHITYNTEKRKPLTHKAEKTPKAEGFPFDADTAAKMVADTKAPKTLALDLGDGKKMDMVLIPAGKFVQGSNDSFYDEGPAKLAEVEKPFYMAKFELTNDLYRQFNKDYDSGFQDRQWKDHVNQGYPSNDPQQPAIRLCYNQAQEFCAWLSKKLGVKVSLPTETQWEWAARGGSDQAFWFGEVGTDFSKLENFSDAQATKFAVSGVNPQPMKNPNAFYTFIPADRNSDDGELIAAKVGKYKANPFGLHDIAGNVAEWVEGNYSKPLGGESIDKAVARGGSWRDRPSYGKVTLRRPYEKWQGVYNVGFRVIIEADEAAKLAK